MSNSLGKKEREILEKIKSLQATALRDLKINAENLKSTADELIKKINSDGTSGYYSTNSDCNRYSNAVWRACLRLCELKRLEDDLLKTFCPKRLSESASKANKK